MPTLDSNEEPNVSDSFADIELKQFMKSLGFEFSHHEGIADWFVKDEGTSELTVFGAREMMQLILTDKQAAIREARIDENKRWKTISKGRFQDTIETAEFTEQITNLKKGDSHEQGIRTNG